MRRRHVTGALAGAAALVLSWGIGAHEAWACGGCFVPPPPPQETQTVSVITDEQMILSVSMGQTTLYDEITYSGSPATFAWVLPIKGTVTVGLSADILFQTLNQLTATQVTSPPENCPPPPNCGGGGGGCAFSGGSASASFAVPSAAGGFAEDALDAGVTVTVTSQKQVGPYETVQLHSTDGSALTNWLTAHGYDIPDSTKPVIAAYVSQGFDFLALKLVPGEGVQSMQPVRVTSQGAAPALPLHMVAVGTGATTGITIWVVADARWEPSNFPTFTISDSEIAWDWATSSSNYESLRLSKEATFNGSGWQIESSLELSQYAISQALETNITYDANGLQGGYVPASAAPDAGAPSLVDGGAPAAKDAGEDAGFDGGEGFDAGEGEGQGPQYALATADLAVLFSGIAAPNVRITRMRSDVAKAALSQDMILQASADQSELSNLHTAQLEIGEPLCPVYDNQCTQVGTAPRSQAQAQPSSGGGCTTTPPRDVREGGGMTLALILSVFGVSFVRVRSQRGRRARGR